MKERNKLKNLVINYKFVVRKKKKKMIINYIHEREIVGVKPLAMGSRAKINGKSRNRL